MSAQQGRDSGRELRRIVRINEEIKHVVATAAKINLMAMNAIFLAKRAGHSALGFGVLSNELRRFALDLQGQMVRLREATHGSVATVTVFLKRTRQNRIFGRIIRQASTPARAHVEAFLLERQEKGLGREREQLAALERRLTQMIADTAQLVEMGSVLARSAKIEAAYGGAHAAALMQVSSDFERTIGEIRHSLEALIKQQDDGS
ncbi:MAG: chemotaxis protein [Rhodocyclaceae bacterium]|nr:chemotaxis protein [Rhodocyclaceae bacterium]